MRRIALLLALSAVAVLLFAAGAGAETFEAHELAGTFDGHDAIGAPAFGAEALEKIAIDETTGNVYVGGRFFIYKFDANGVSEPWSSVAPETILKDPISESEYSVGDLAVDNSGGANQNRIFGFKSEGPLNLYEPSGTPYTGAGFPVPLEGRVCGIAPEPNGDFWLRSNDGPAVEYHSDGTPTGEEVEFESYAFSCAIAVDGEDFLIPENSSGGPLYKYDSSGHIIQYVDGSGRARMAAVDQSNGDIYVDAGTTINHYNAAGEFLDSFGTLNESKSIAVDSSNHDVYALDYGPPEVVQKFTPSGTQLTVPDAVTEPSTETTRVGATVHGTVKPDGSPITECAFEYGFAEYGGFTHTIPCAEGDSFGAETSVHAVIEDVEPAYEYEYRLRVGNADGSGHGKIEFFKTPTAVKELNTEEATGVDFSHATLHGSFDPDGLETTYYFWYGPGFSLQYESEHLKVSGSGTFHTELPLSGLEAGTSPQGKEFYFELIAENATGRTYSEGKTFTLPPAVHGVETGAVEVNSLTSATLHGSFEPRGVETHYYIEYGSTASYGHYAPAGPPGEVSSSNGVVNVTAPVTGLPRGSVVHYRMVAVNATGETAGADNSVLLGEAPEITEDLATEVNTDTTVVKATINPDNRATTYHFEYGLEDCSKSACQPSEAKTLPSGLGGVPVHLNLEGLTPGATYHFRVVASNELGETVGEDHNFITYVQEPGGDTCPNVLVRKQTGAAATSHCRAYELVSAANTNGYDVESNLISGLTPMPGFPNADGKVLYTVRFGSLPGSGNPTNNGGDPYLATRGENGWTTEYLGFQANGTPSAKPFASSVLEAAQGLGALAFGGPELCSPCFEDNSRNIPVRTGSGPIEKGMAGSLNPAGAEPAGEIAKTFSADGSHLIFGSTSQFESAGNSGSLSIYERQLGGKGGGTEVVSTLPDGSTMPGPGTAELDVSEDGSRVLIGREVGTDADGNRLYDLYMHFSGSADSVEVANTAGGVLYGGMSADGSKVFFTSADQLAGDTDASADLFRADVTSAGATVTRVSTGSGSGDTDACNPVANSAGNHWNMPGSASAANCGVVAIGGGGGVASDSGTIYFLSPEQLDGSEGTAGRPNLYVAEPGGQPAFVATLDPDNPAVLDAVSEAARRETADFQTTPDGQFAVFGNGTVLTKNETDGRAEIYRSEIGGGLACVSCIPSNTVPTTDTRLTAKGLNLTDDGRVFFTTAEQLILRDTNQVKDVYEWDEGKVAIVSTGLDSNDSGLLTASDDGRDVYFFTRQTLAPQDENGGAMKIYDAREEGGFLYNPSPRPCVASDECHGAGTQQAPPPAINTIEGNGREQRTPESTKPKPKRCHKGTVKRHGKCVKTPKHHRAGKGHKHG